jgi:3-hydroxybutyryl-CoA dehydratase
MQKANPVQAGTTISFRKTMTVAEQALFTGISGNLAPLCVDARAARAAGFGGALCFELALASLATTCLNRIGGAGWRIGTVVLDFSAALPVGSTIEATVVVTEVLPEAIRCDVICKADEHGCVMAGSATLVPLAA